MLQASLVSLSVEDVSAALGCARNIYSPVMKVPMELHTLKGQCHEIFDFRFSTWISYPQAPEYTIRAVRVFFKYAEIFAAQVHHRCDTGGKLKKSSIRKVLIFLTPLDCVVIDKYFSFKFTLRCQQSDTVPIICLQFDNGGKFAASVIDTGGKNLKWP